MVRILIKYIDLWFTYNSNLTIIIFPKYSYILVDS